jgi:nicotinamidase-related amidase
MKPFLSRAPYDTTPLLVCLDLQRAHTAPGAPDPDGAARCVERCKRLLRHARHAGWRIAHVQQHDGRMAVLPERSRPIEGLEPRPSEAVFYREQPSAFASSAFADYVERLARPRLLMIGFDLAGSVLCSTVAASERGLAVTVVEGAVAAPAFGRFSSEVMGDVLLSVLGGFADIAASEEILFSTGPVLVHAANHP